MKQTYVHMDMSVKHLKSLEKTFSNKNNFTNPLNFDLYKHSSLKLSATLHKGELDFIDQLYSQENRQMILADMLEYIFLSRGLLSVLSKTNKFERNSCERGNL